MTPLEANDDSHLFFVPPPSWKSRDILNTTAERATQKIHGTNIFLSCAVLAQGTHARVHSVSNADHFTLVTNPEFVQPALHDAPAAAKPPAMPGSGGRRNNSTGAA